MGKLWDASVQETEETAEIKDWQAFCVTFYCIHNSMDIFYFNSNQKKFI